MASFKAALVVVDFQEDFCPPKGSLAIPGGRSIAPTVNSLMSLPFALRVATLDWHPRDHVSFASNHPPPHNVPLTSTLTVPNPSNPAETETIRLWPDHCVQDTPGAELIPEFDAARVDHLVRKGTDSRVEMLSAFRDTYRAPRVYESDLSAVLKKAGVTHVFLAGLARDYCVKYSAIDAAEDGFKTALVMDATATIRDGEEATRALEEELGKHGIELVNAEEVKKRLAASH